MQYVGVAYAIHILVIILLARLCIVEHIVFILYVTYIDVLSYWAWHCITSFIYHVIQIYVRQKDNANQWKVVV